MSERVNWDVCFVATVRNADGCHSRDGSST